MFTTDDELGVVNQIDSEQKDGEYAQEKVNDPKMVNTCSLEGYLLDFDEHGNKSGCHQNHTSDE